MYEYINEIQNMIIAPLYMTKSEIYIPSRDVLNDSIKLPCIPESVLYYL